MLHVRLSPRQCIPISFFAKDFKNQVVRNFSCHFELLRLQVFPTSSLILRRKIGIPQSVVSYIAAVVTEVRTCRRFFDFLRRRTWKTSFSHYSDKFSSVLKHQLKRGALKWSIFFTDKTTRFFILSTSRWSQELLAGFVSEKMW